MPPLNNPKHEKYCQNLFQGQPQNAAYEAAGYKYHEGNASRLRRDEKVVARLTELQETAARATECTVESLLAELELARSKAVSLDQLSAAVKATAEKAKISGLLIQRVEVSNTNGMTLDDDNTPEDVAIHWAKEAGVNLTPQELETFMGLIRGWYASIQEFLASCKAKLVNEAPSPVEIERRRLALASRNARANGSNLRD